MRIRTEKRHWTERRIKDYLFSIVADFITQLEAKMDLMSISQDEYAKKLTLSKGRVSQLLNHPTNFKLETIIKYARALGMKISLVAYDDNDPQNTKGPINSEIFRMCWEQSGKPRDFWAMQDNAANNRSMFRRADDVNKIFSDFKMLGEKKSTLGDLPGCPSFVRIGRFEGNKTSENIKPS